MFQSGPWCLQSEGKKHSKKQTRGFYTCLSLLKDQRMYYTLRRDTLILPPFNNPLPSSRVPPISITLDEQHQRCNDTDDNPPNRSNQNRPLLQLLRIRRIRTISIRTTADPARRDIQRVKVYPDLAHTVLGGGSVQGTI